MSMAADFSTLLRPNEVLVWQAKAQPAPRPWRQLLMFCAAVVVLLLLLSPRIATLADMAHATGILFALRYLGVVQVVFLVGVLGAILYWLGAIAKTELWPTTAHYGLSDTRAFRAIISRRGVVQSAGAVNTDAVLTTVDLKGGQALLVPLRGDGSAGDVWVFGNLSAADYQSGLAQLTAIMGSAEWS
jgi:hypothetical protein